MQKDKKCLRSFLSVKKLRLDRLKINFLGGWGVTNLERVEKTYNKSIIKGLMLEIYALLDDNTKKIEVLYEDRILSDYH